MSVQLVTAEDLQILKREVLSGVKDLINAAITPKKELLRNKDVKEILGISTATLQTLRINGTLTHSKVGGTLYYKYSDVMKVFDENIRKGLSSKEPVSLGGLIEKEVNHGRG